MGLGLGRLGRPTRPLIPLPELLLSQWSRDELARVVSEKHALENRNASTHIICRFFLEAVEKKLYGYRWVCPNGGKACAYRHALPHGFQMKSQLRALALEALEAGRRDVSVVIEEARRGLATRTPITDDVFREWRRGKEAARRDREAEAKATRARDDRMTGRAR